MGDADTTITIRVFPEDPDPSRIKDYTITLHAPQEVTAFFPLYVDSVCQPTNDITGLEAFAPIIDANHGLRIYDYKASLLTTPSIDWSSITPAPDPSVVNSMQRVTTQSGAFSDGSSSPSMDQWVQFAVSTSGIKTLTVDTISFYGAGGGGSNMNWVVRYSQDPNCDWTQATQLGSMTLATGSKNKVYFEQATGRSIAVTPGGTLYVRIFPYWTQGATKYLVLQSFKVHGHAQ
jgi:hypothetical protein